MKLLFDENLSDRLPQMLADVFPDARHVKTSGLMPCQDGQIWDDAIAHDLAVVTKDRDFNQRAAHEGPPPKIVFLTIGNCSTRAVARLLRENASQISSFFAEKVTSVMVLPV